jgi:hypothetical protein
MHGASISIKGSITNAWIYPVVLVYFQSTLKVRIFWKWHWRGHCTRKGAKGAVVMAAALVKPPRIANVVGWQHLLSTISSGRSHLCSFATLFDALPPRPPPLNSLHWCRAAEWELMVFDHCVWGRTFAQLAVKEKVYGLKIVFVIRVVLWRSEPMRACCIHVGLIKALARNGAPVAWVVILHCIRLPLLFISRDLERLRNWNCTRKLIGPLIGVVFKFTRWNLRKSSRRTHIGKRIGSRTSLLLTLLRPCTRRQSMIWVERGLQALSKTKIQWIPGIHAPAREARMGNLDTQKKWLTQARIHSSPALESLRLLFIIIGN